MEVYRAKAAGPGELPRPYRRLQKCLLLILRGGKGDEEGADTSQLLLCSGSLSLYTLQHESKLQRR